MHQTHKRVLAGLERMGGEARIDVMSKGTGISNRTINNSLRRLVPEYIEIVGREARRGDDREAAKVLRLTEAGREIGAETNIEMDNEDPIWAMQEEIGNIYARLTDVEKANAKLARQNQRLIKHIERLLEAEVDAV